MEEKDVEKINDKLVDIITLLAFIDTKLGVITEKIPKSSPYQSAMPPKHYHSITCSKED